MMVTLLSGKDYHKGQCHRGDSLQNFIPGSQFWSMLPIGCRRTVGLGARVNTMRCLV